MVFSDISFRGLGKIVVPFMVVALLFLFSNVTMITKTPKIIAKVAKK